MEDRIEITERPCSVESLASRPNSKTVVDVHIPCGNTVSSSDICPVTEVTVNEEGVIRRGRKKRPRKVLGKSVRQKRVSAKRPIFKVSCF